MKQFQYTIKDELGVHARPAGLLVKLVKGYASTATLEKGGKTCDLRKLMALMGMGVKRCRRGDPEVPERERLIACNVVMRSPRGRLRGLFRSQTQEI